VADTYWQWIVETTSAAKDCRDNNKQCRATHG